MEGAGARPAGPGTPLPLSALTVLLSALRVDLLTRAVAFALLAGLTLRPVSLCRVATLLVLLSRLSARLRRDAALLTLIAVLVLLLVLSWVGHEVLLEV
jgi:hypothetical protein